MRVRAPIQMNKCTTSMWLCFVFVWRAGKGSPLTGSEDSEVESGRTSPIAAAPATRSATGGKGVLRSHLQRSVALGSNC